MLFLNRNSELFNAELSTASDKDNFHTPERRGQVCDKHTSSRRSLIFSRGKSLRAASAAGGVSFWPWAHLTWSLKNLSWGLTEKHVEFDSNQFTDIEAIKATKAVWGSY